MRLSATLLMSVALFATAHAAPWTDPSDTISLDTPAGWQVESAPADGLTYIVASSSTNECHIVGLPRASTADTPAHRMRTAAQEPLDVGLWTQVAGMFPDLFPGAVTVASHTVDAEPFWPVQRADFAVAGGAPVYGAIQFRPGIEVWALCRSRNGGAADTVAFESLFRSIGTTNDAALRQQAEREQDLADENGRHARANLLGDRGPVGSTWSHATTGTGGN